MPEYLRVRDRATKHQYSIVASAFREDAHELLDKPAAHSDGTPLPPKYYEAPAGLSNPNATQRGSAGRKATIEEGAD